MITTCYMCGMEFTPDPELVKRWAESDKPYEPTDWECGECDVIPDACEQCPYAYFEDCSSMPCPAPETLIVITPQQ